MTSLTSVFFIILCSSFIISSTNAFVPLSKYANVSSKSTLKPITLVKMSDEAEDPFDMMISIPPTSSGLIAELKLKPILEVPSTMVEVRYKLPFGLDVAPKEGLAVCTKDGAGGEKIGDVLRFTSQWTMGLPRGNGLVSTAASFSGAIGWQCSLFDVTKASSWEEVVQALTSNVDSRTDEVVLLFERPIASD